MKSNTRVVVIGGGIIGCSVLYHLTRLGWRDVVLVERDELTSGATWHAAGQTHHYAESAFLAQVAKDSLDFYRTLEAQTGESCGVHVPGGLRLTRHRDGIDEFKRYLPQAALLGIDAEIVGPNRVRELWPLLECDDFLGALHTPGEGYVDASMTTNTIAKAAQTKGAEIYRRTVVNGLELLPSGEWKTVTDRGDIISEYVVNCAGSWGGEISALLGHYLPTMTMEHQYLVTEQCHELESLVTELPVLRDPSVPCYVRQERNGLMVSAFEHQAKLRWLDGAPSDFSMSLFPSDLDRSAACLEQTFEMVPLLKNLGVRAVVNGPIPATPDLQGLLGPAHGLRNYFVCCGIHGGFVQGALARHLAEWLVEGEPVTDLSSVDVRRFGAYANQDFAVARLCAAHTMFAQPANFPAMEPEGARPARIDGLYYRLAERGAVFGQINGWEVANWFAPAGVERRDYPSFDRANWFQHVANECKAVRLGVGVLNFTALSSFAVTGAAARSVLDRISANHVPRVAQRRTSPFLTPAGNAGLVVSVDCIDEQTFLLTAPASVELQLADWLQNRVNGDDVSICNISDESGVLLLAGPKTTGVLESFVDRGLADVPRHHLVEFSIGGDRATLVRVDDIDDQVWELHHQRDAQGRLYDALLAAGQDAAISDFGMRAYESLRLERALPRWGVDYSMATTMEAAGLGHLVATHKEAFAGRTAVGKRAGDEDQVVVRWLQIDDTSLRSDPWGGEVVEANGKPIGVVTSGARGHTMNRSLAFAQIDRAFAATGTQVQIVMLGERHNAQLACQSRVALAT